MSFYLDKSTIKDMIKRILNLDNPHNDSTFVWGARQVGKTTKKSEKKRSQEI